VLRAVSFGASLLVPRAVVLWWLGIGISTCAISAAVVSVGLSVSFSGGFSRSFGRYLSRRLARREDE